MVSKKPKKPARKARVHKGGGSDWGVPTQVSLNTSETYPKLDVTLGSQQGIFVANGCLAWMDGDLDFQTVNKGGIWAGLQRSLFAGSSFFIGEVSNTTPQPLTLAICSPSIGDILALDINEGQEYIFNPESIIAFTANVDVSSAFRFKGVFGNGPFYEHATSKKGLGRVWISTSGNLKKLDVVAGTSVKVDNYYFVACANSTDFAISTFSKTNAGMFSKVKNFMLSSYGFTLTFTGPTQIWVQTKSLKRQADALTPYLAFKRDVQDEDAIASTSGFAGGILGSLLSSSSS